MPSSEEVDSSKTSDQHPASEIDFVTMGMFILDQIDFYDGTSVNNIIGGAGSYAVFGARVFCSPPRSKAIGWIVDCGNDFPDNILPKLGSLETTMVVRMDGTRKTTRGWNVYDGEGEVRGFKYLTPKRRLEPKDLFNATPRLDRTRSLHLICSPLRAKESIQSFLSLSGGRRPLFIWEPVPDLCMPENRDTMVEMLNEVDIMSPNHNELKAFFEKTELEGIRNISSSTRVTTEKGLVEELCRRLVRPTHRAFIVVRCGSLGCFIYGYIAHDHKPLPTGTWLPPFYAPLEGGKNHPSVVDTTGGGNAFLGAFTISLVLQQREQDSKGENNGAYNYDYVRAAAYGAVGASFAIEQVGVPKVKCEGDKEIWNGGNTAERLERYLGRICICPDATSEI